MPYLTQRFLSAPVLSILVLTLVAVAIGSWTLPAQAQNAPLPAHTVLAGWAWSETTGWISFDCDDLGACASSDYGVSVEDDGSLSGMAWSENIGWVSANVSDVSGCPSAPCTPRIVGGELTGWLKTLSGGSPESGGWDGWISLRGPQYGVNIDGEGKFSGYAWGYDVVGWTDFSLVRMVSRACEQRYFCINDDLYIGEQSAACEATNQLVRRCDFGCAGNSCLLPEAPSGELRAIPSLVRSGNTTQVYWDIKSANSCSVVGGGSSWSGVASSANGETSEPVTERTIYSLLCTGPGGVLDKTATVNILPIFEEQ